MPKFEVERVSLKVIFPDSTMVDERYGGSGDMVLLEGELLRPKDHPSKTCIFFMHPSGIQNMLPMPNGLAKAGVHAVTCSSRYPNNDTCLIMEKVLFDLSECIKQVKQKFGYEKVVLGGWSGGGSLSSFYQSQAEHPTYKLTPAGDPVDLTTAGLVPADAVVLMAAHISRAKTFTEWIDPAVLDETNPDKRNPELDIFDTKSPNAPLNKYARGDLAKFTFENLPAEFKKRYHEAQVARNRRITKWVRGKLLEIEKDLKNSELQKNTWRRFKKDEVFNIHCTQADIRRLGLPGAENTVDGLAKENHSPVGLAKATTLRSFLSQWSYDESRADGPKCIGTVNCPVLVVSNGADHLVPLRHAQEFYNAVKHNRKELYVVKNAAHYYFGQKKEMGIAIQKVISFLSQYDLIENGLLDDQSKL